MMDTEGSEVHTSQLDQPMKAEVHLPAGKERLASLKQCAYALCLLASSGQRLT